MIRTGIIGLSEGNGHPYSFSAIVNGYNEDYFSQSGWDVILDYLKAHEQNEFKEFDAQITHAWTQDHKITKNLCDSCFIEHNCKNIDEMIGEIDALIIARDDWKSHYQISKQFLLKGIPVFIDKPLTLDSTELEFFEPYLDSGLLMSCSGLRFSPELEKLRNKGINKKKTKLISATILNDIEKYGIHMLEAIASIDKDFSKYSDITRLNSLNQSFAINFNNGTTLNLNCLGKVAKTFHLSLFFNDKHEHYNFNDNFGAFKATLKNFYRMVDTKTPQIDPMQTNNLMKILMKARELEPGESFNFK